MVFATSDLHGNLDVWENICGYLGEDDRLFVLGDCIDRGDYSILIASEVRMDKRMVYLKGNHEDMFVKAMRSKVELPLYLLNGGGRTIEYFYGREREMDDWIDYFDNLPEVITYTNTNGQKVVMTHAGYTPGLLTDYLWDRRHYLSYWPEWYFDSYPDQRNDIIVHGHTPVRKMIRDMSYRLLPYEQEVYGGVVKYADGHKYNIDLGTVDTKKACLLNLDTFEPIYFGVDGILDVDDGLLRGF